MFQFCATSSFCSSFVVPAKRVTRLVLLKRTKFQWFFYSLKKFSFDHQAIFKRFLVSSKTKLLWSPYQFTLCNFVRFLSEKLVSGWNLFALEHLQSWCEQMVSFNFQVVISFEWLSVCSDKLRKPNFDWDWQRAMNQYEGRNLQIFRCHNHMFANCLYHSVARFYIFIFPTIKWGGSPLAQNNYHNKNRSTKVFPGRKVN